MSTYSMILTAAILLLWALLTMIALWLLAVRKAYRLEDLLEMILEGYGFSGREIRAIIDGDARLDVEGRIER